MACELYESCKDFALGFCLCFSSQIDFLYFDTLVMCKLALAYFFVYFEALAFAIQSCKSMYD